MPTRRMVMPLLALEPLPCGCVAGVYHALPSAGEVTVLEAKGPHCVFPRHRAGSLAGLGLDADMVADAGEPFF